MKLKHSVPGNASCHLGTIESSELAIKIVLT